MDEVDRQSFAEGSFSSMTLWPKLDLLGVNPHTHHSSSSLSWPVSEPMVLQAGRR